MQRNDRVTLSSSRLRKSMYPAPLALAIAMAVGQVHAATIVVDSADTTSESGKCTIVDAVAAVNAGAPVNNCNADGNSDTIDLSSFTSPTTITFTSVGAMQSHALVLTSPTTISAPLDPTGAPLVTLARSAVTGTPAFGIIHTTSPLTITGLRIENGNSGAYLGGGVLAGGALTVTSSVISGNNSDSAGGGIAGTGKVALYHSTVSGNTAGNAGGGIYSGGAVVLAYSTVSNNSTTVATASVNGGGGALARGAASVTQSKILDNTSASAAGGLYAAGGISVSSSTISGNVAQAGSGGGLYLNPATTGVNLAISGSTINGNTAQGNGGGVLGGDVGIENSTLTANVASGTGGAVQASALMLSYATIAQNQSTGYGGGVDFTSSADITGTIVYANTPQDVAGAATATGKFNIIAGASVGVPADSQNCDPELGALSDNGGPTQTMALGAGSCAIDGAGNAPSVTTDQRGYGRPVGSGTSPLADIGAFESGAKDPDVIFSDGFGG